MEQTRKHLKTSSFIVLLFAALSLLQIVSELLWGELNSAEIPAGSPENILLITKTILLGVSLILLLPKFYVGIQGLRMAKKPAPSKKHITLAVIIFVCSALGLIEPIAALLKQGSVSESVSSILGVLLELVIYYDHIKYAKAVAKLAE